MLICLLWVKIAAVKNISNQSVKFKTGQLSLALKINSNLVL